VTALANAVTISNGAVLNGLFYAPNGRFITSAPLDMYGAVFAGSYQASQRTNIHYDLAATRVGMDCPPPPPPGDAGVPDASTDGGPPGGCTSCRDCGNQACIDGACGDCRTDGDCCSPLYCIAGRCIPAPG
jgi:hypothetical protein